MEEGVCDAIALSLTPEAEEGMLQDIGPSRSLWLERIQRVGVDRLHALATKADAEGLEVIPQSWLDE